MATIVGFGGADHPGTVSTMIDPKTARELSRAAKQVQSSLLRRDELIVQAHGEGAGVREIARIAGLTHPTVLNILRRESQGSDGT